MKTFIVLVALGMLSMISPGSAANKPATPSVSSSVTSVYYWRHHWRARHWYRCHYYGRCY